MDDKQIIIQTRFKSKIPGTMSWPIGAQMISDALHGVPQFDQLAVSFYFWNTPADRHKAATPYQVIGVRYSGPSRDLIGSTSIEAPRWAITVRPVPRRLRHEVQTRLLAEALPSMRGWLVKNSHTNDREGHHSMVFNFDELTNELSSAEFATALWETEKADR